MVLLLVVCGLIFDSSGPLLRFVPLLDGKDISR
jgi:hypothetical protein